LDQRYLEPHEANIEETGTDYEQDLDLTNQQQEMLELEHRQEDFG